MGTCTPAKPKDAYRKHDRARALDDVRPELVRRILDRIGRDELSASGIRRATGIDIGRTGLWELREGILDGWSDNRLLLLGERLGVRAKVTLH